MKLMMIATALFFFSRANANIARANISNVGVSLYGVFITSDPSCQANLIASVPLTKTAVSSNFVTSPIIGAGPVPSKIGCVVLVVANQVQVTWQASNYAASDNSCNAGGSTNVNPCSQTPLTWPAIITQSAQQVGLNLSASCPTHPTGSEVIPIFMSIDSVCTGSSVIDSQTNGCTLSGKSTSSVAVAPASISSSTAGARIQYLPVNGRVVFAVDPDQIISGQSGVCSAVSSPVFSIHQ